MQQESKVKLKGFKNNYCDAVYCALGEFVDPSKYDINMLNDEELKTLCEYSVVKNIMAGVEFLNIKVPRFGVGRWALDKYNIAGKEVVDAEQISLLPTSALIGERLVVELDNLSEYSPNFLSEVSEFVALSKCGLIIKLGQDLEEVGKLVNKYKISPVEMLESFGFLDRDCQVYGLNYIDKDDQKLLNNYNISCIFSPLSDGEEGRGAINLYNFIYNDLKFGFSSGKCYNINMLLQAKLAFLNTSNLMLDNSLLDVGMLLDCLTYKDGKIELEFDECERIENVLNKSVLREHNDYKILREKVKNIAKELKEI